MFLSFQRKPLPERLVRLGHCMLVPALGSSKQDDELATPLKGKWKFVKVIRCTEGNLSKVYYFRLLHVETSVIYLIMDHVHPKWCNHLSHSFRATCLVLAWFLQVSRLLTKNWVVPVPGQGKNAAERHQQSRKEFEEPQLWTANEDVHFREGSWGVTGDSSRDCCENGSTTYSNFLTSMYRCSRFGDLDGVADDVWNLDQIAIRREIPILISNLMAAVMFCFPIVRLHRSKRHLQIWGAWFATVDRSTCIVTSFMWHIVS